MVISDIIRLGDKVEARLIQKSKDKKGELSQTLKSQVLDIKENGNLELAMPTERGHLILLPLGVRFEFVFYSYTGKLYKAIGQVVERYKKDGFYMVEVRLRTRLEKFQRREHYRYKCAMNFSFYILNEEQKELESADEIYRNLLNHELENISYRGVAVDLSGGGMRFRSPYELQADDKIMVLFQLRNDKVDEYFHVLGDVIECNEISTSSTVLYESRIVFDIQDNRVQEEIIRYIFEEERKIRQKENG